MRPPKPESLDHKGLKGKVKSLNHVPLFATPWTIAYEATPSMGFSRRECWSGLPFSSPGGLPNPGIERGSPTLQTDTLPSEPPGKPPQMFAYLKKEAILVLNSIYPSQDEMKNSHI